MASSRLFVDTGAWVAIQIPDDRHHPAAAAALPALLSAVRMLVTSNLVVGETFTLLRITRGYDVARSFLDRTAATRKLEIAFVSRELEDRAYGLIDRYRDHAFSYVDATSFALMRAHRIDHAFAFDRHFATAGFARVPADLPVEQL